MSAKAKPNMRDAILDAMLDVVVERGFHEASMALISERSGASPGGIYHHFSGKDAIIEAAYERVYSLKIASLLKGYSDEMDAKDAFLQGCVNIYNFCRRHQREMRFLEQYESAGFPCRPSVYADNTVVASFAQRFSSRSKGGVLREWPREVLEETTLGLVERLAQQPRRLSATELAEISEGLWELVRAR